MDVSLTVIQWLLISSLASGCPARAAEALNSEFLILKSSLNSLPCSQHSHSHSLCEAPAAEAQTQVTFFPLLKIREADIKLGLKWRVHSRKLRAHPQVVWGMAQTQMTQHSRCSLYLSDSLHNECFDPKAFMAKLGPKLAGENRVLLTRESPGSGYQMEELSIAFGVRNVKCARSKLKITLLCSHCDNLC